MREAGTEVRKSVYNALNGNVTIDADPVGVFDGKFEALPDIDEGVWIIIGEQNSTDQNTKHLFASQESIEVIIANKSQNVAGKEIVETVADEVLQIIIPTTKTHGLTVTSPYSITYVKYDNGRGNKVDQGIAKQFDNIKTLNFLIRVTQ